MADSKSSVTQTMLATLAGIIGSGTAMSLGSSYGTAEGAWMLFSMLCAILTPVYAGGIIREKRNKELESKLLERKNGLIAIANKYNNVTTMLENSYDIESQSLGLFAHGQKERLRRQYEQRYNQNKKAYEQERQAFLNDFNDHSPARQKQVKFWKWALGLGLIAQLSAFGYTLGTVAGQEPEIVTQQVIAEERQWSAQDIPMPHLTDGSRYVSNPDNVVSASTETQLNQILNVMDDSLNVESAMIIVNHVANQDIFRFAQDIFDIYHVGKNDHGLVVVLAYQDHLARIHTGRSLESELTDIESSRLQRDYLIPYVKAEMPDSGMLALTQAIYNMLQKKDLSGVATYSKPETDDPLGGLIALYFILFGGWCVLLVYVLSHLGKINAAAFRPNPFAAAQTGFVVGGGHFGGGGGGGHFGGGGGFGGGGFSGGSSGGGGATSSW